MSGKERITKPQNIIEAILEVNSEKISREFLVLINKSGKTIRFQIIKLDTPWETEVLEEILIPDNPSVTLLKDKKTVRIKTNEGEIYLRYFKCENDTHAWAKEKIEELGF